MTDIFIIDDHPLLIDGVISAFKYKKDQVNVVGKAYSASEALEKLKTSTAKVILLDLLMPELSGVEFCLIIKREFPDKKIIALTGETDPALLYNAWINGVDAILMKHCGKKEIKDTIRKVLDDNKIIGNNVPPFFAQTGIIKGGLKITLTKREQQVLSTLAQTGDRRSAAEQLQVTKHSIDFHCRNIYKKFNKNNLISVIEEARKMRIIS